MAKFCGKCGTKLEDEKCPKCDAKVEKEVVKAEPVRKASEGKTNGLSVAGFVLSLTSFLFTLLAIPGLILSIIGLSQIKKTGDEGKGLAIAGIIVSSIVLGLVLIILFFVLIFAAAGAAYYY